MKTILDYETVALVDDDDAIEIIDQTLLPGTIRRIQLHTREEIWEAIKKLRVRGAPAIGVTAAYGLALLASGIDAADFDNFYESFAKEKEYLASSRPTAVNLFWALDRMDRTAKENRALDLADLKRVLWEEADAIREEDVQISRNIGMIGLSLMKKTPKSIIYYFPSQTVRDLINSFAIDIIENFYEGDY